MAARGRGKLGGHKPLTCTSSNIGHFHQALTDGFRAHIEGEPEIVVTEGKDRWMNPHYSGDASFGLFTKGAPQYTPLASGRRPVCQLVGFDAEDVESAWVAWSDRWTSSRGGAGFDLQDAGFVFYWGRSHDMNSVFRAEWTLMSTRPKTSGHPHWHIDQSPYGTLLDASRLHLAMGGWDCNADPEEYWHKPLDSFLALAHWAIRTLEYSRSQFKDYPPSGEVDPLRDIRA